jgi:hypothetical protein
MDYQNVVRFTARILANNPHQSVMVWGPPGCGKSHAMCVGLPEALGMKPLGHPDSAVRMFRPSVHDPVDLIGLPAVTEESTSWVTPDILLEVNGLAERHGRALFVIDELNQSVPMMFNALNGLILDRGQGKFKFHPGVSVVCTGNRQTDKAASNRMPSHTANRLAHFDMDSSLDSFKAFWITNDLPVYILSFLNFKPGLLNAFDPDKRENATERMWEMFARGSGGDSLPLDDTMTMAKAFLGEGIAAELHAFRKAMVEMPNPDTCIADPTGAPLPPSLAAKYAIAGALAHRVTTKNIEAIITYMGRLEKQFEVLAVRESFARVPSIMATPCMLKWSNANSNIFSGFIA